MGWGGFLGRLHWPLKQNTDLYCCIVFACQFLPSVVLLCFVSLVFVVYLGRSFVCFLCVGCLCLCCVVFFVVFIVACLFVSSLFLIPPIRRIR